MYLIQLMHIKEISEVSQPESNNENFVESNVSERKLVKNKDEKKLTESVSKNVKNQLKSTNQIKEKLINEPSLSSKNYEQIHSFKELINLAAKNKEFELKYDLERNVKLVRFEKCKIDISFNEKLNKNFIKNLSEKLKYWTGERWIISLSKQKGEKPIFEINKDEKLIEREKFKNSDLGKKIMSEFSDAQIEDIVDKMTNFTDMLSKAKEMQEKMKQVQDKIKSIEVEGMSGGNLVKVVLKGDYELKAIIIDDKAKKEDQSVINDLIIAAYSNARENLKKKSAEELSKVTGGLNIPFDFKLPF